MEIKIKNTKIEIRITKETPKTKAEIDAELAFTEMNNLYLAIESKRRKISTTDGIRLRTLVGQAYEHGDFMIDWWINEFSKLPGWLNV